MSADTHLADALTRVLGQALRATSRVRGGDFAAAYRVTLADGSVVFAKTHPDPPPGFFTREASDLSWLAEPGAVAVPTVLAAEDAPTALLALAWIDEGPISGADEAAFGRELARLHRAGAPSFGRIDRRTTGSLGLPNEPSETWAEFFAAQRLLPLIRIASDRGALPAPTLVRLIEVATRLSSLAPDASVPDRLHGDLWAGNRLVGADGRSWLIDPAAHGGHREFDLAMMRLFGGFSEACFESYTAEWPLADDWRARIPLHQLAPLTVHAIKFGGSYVTATTRAIDAVLSS